MLSTARKGAGAVADASPAWTSRISIEPVALIALTAIAGVLRFATLTTQSYWFDEAQAAHEMQLSLGALMHTIGAQETSPPLYFALAWVWAKLFGVGEAGLRSLSALLGTAAIPITYLCGRELVSWRAGLVAAALATLSPFMIWYSQEAREYMLLAALSGASLLFFARCLRARTSRNLAWWALFSSLALLTHFFAGFLVGPEAVWLLVRSRARPTALAVGTVVAVELALLPLALSDAAHPLGWLTIFPLSTRIEQVPIAFAFGTLYRSSLINYALLGGGVFVALLILLLLSGADSRELRGAGIAALLVAAVLLIPLLFALVGHDFYIARALMPAWIPLAVLTGAACTASRARALGGLLAAALLISFVLAQIRVSDNAQYQRPDWRGVAAALGKPTAARAIVVYNAQLATDPLQFYLAGVGWNRRPTDNVAVGELDVVASAFDALRNPAPTGVRLLSKKIVAGYLVARFALSSPLSASATRIGARATGLLSTPPPAPAVLVQRPG
jgi:uncharacterized membrane protein